MRPASGYRALSSCPGGVHRSECWKMKSRERQNGRLQNILEVLASTLNGSKRGTTGVYFLMRGGQNGNPGIIPLGIKKEPRKSEELMQRKQLKSGNMFLFACFALLACSSAFAATITVTNTNDSGSGSL